MEPLLTSRQKAVLTYLREYHSEVGLMPSTREIQRHFGFSSQTAAMSHLRALEKKHQIQRLPGIPRAVIFPEDLDRGPLMDIPIYGHIPAGMAAADVAQAKMGTMAIDAASLGLSPRSSVFALRVRGESMIGAHIVPGDLVILENREARDKDIVAALIDGESTLKRCIFNKNKPYLKSENPEFPDLTPVRELMVQGVMVGLIRTKNVF